MGAPPPLFCLFRATSEGVVRESRRRRRAEERRCARDLRRRRRRLEPRVCSRSRQGSLPLFPRERDEGSPGDSSRNRAGALDRLSPAVDSSRRAASTPTPPTNQIPRNRHRRRRRLVASQFTTTIMMLYVATRARARAPCPFFFSLVTAGRAPRRQGRRIAPGRQRREPQPRHSRVALVVQPGVAAAQAAERRPPAAAAADARPVPPHDERVVVRARRWRRRRRRRRQAALATEGMRATRHLRSRLARAIVVPLSVFVWLGSVLWCAVFDRAGVRRASLVGRAAGSRGARDEESSLGLDVACTLRYLRWTGEHAQPRRSRRHARGAGRAARAPCAKAGFPYTPRRGFVSFERGNFRHRNMIMMNYSCEPPPC